jgi:hypothetical protein
MRVNLKGYETVSLVTDLALVNMLFDQVAAFSNVPNEHSEFFLSRDNGLADLSLGQIPTQNEN